MNLKFMQKILDVLNEEKEGLVIKDIMRKSKLSRGSIKTHLDILIYTSQVREKRYCQNLGVFFANRKKVLREVKNEK